MLVVFGKTRVLVAASVTVGVPRWRRDTGLGWVTAEYSMLPRATHSRSDRESVRGRIGGRTHEISIVLDCDVLQADGGTRTAAITGAYVALADAVAHLRELDVLKGEPLKDSVAAVSVGFVEGVPLLDLAYEEDSQAGTDMNIVMTGSGDFIEVQGTAERKPFNRTDLNQLLDLGAAGCAELTRLQREALA